MNLEEKKAEVLKALETYEVSQRSIDSTKGRNARQLRQGEAIGEKPIKSRRKKTTLDPGLLHIEDGPYILLEFNLI